MKSILYATDYSEASVSALQCAQTLSRMLGMRLVLTHVFDVPSVLGTELQAPYPRLHTDAIASERRRLERFYENAGKPEETLPQLQIEPVENMSVLSGIISKASEWHARLIVVGMKGETRLMETIMGSTTKKLIDKAPCPVLAVPAGYRFEEPASMVYATDFEVEDLKALEKVIALARAFDAEVRVVHVTADREHIGDSQMAWFKSMLQERTDYENLYFELLESKDVAHTLKDYSEHLHAGLIGMLERNHRDRVKRWFRKDLVKQMASASHIPLLSFNEQNLQTLFF
ncbi:universal stress protein [Robiginitalea sp. M366]|uniref:universal stress protein n=1 Tax=Robiginitalea aestuariiviva TaxID=3036903 RepID=UPI00240E48AF|nr:universal stress protein [Robiginitalea aestuariiviva]MDG1572040.1 universal stress protein [Robiginitalea aestuariiviva]